MGPSLNYVQYYQLKEFLKKGYDNNEQSMVDFMQKLQKLLSKYNIDVLIELEACKKDSITYAIDCQKGDKSQYVHDKLLNNCKKLKEPAKLLIEEYEKAHAYSTAANVLKIIAYVVTTLIALAALVVSIMAYCKDDKTGNSSTTETPITNQNT